MQGIAQTASEALRSSAGRSPSNELAARASCGPVVTEDARPRAYPDRPVLATAADQGEIVDAQAPVRTSAACNRISGPAPDCRSTDTGIQQSGRRRPPRCSGYAYHPTARQAAAGLHCLGAAGEDRYTVPALLPRQTAPYRHTLGGPLSAPDLPEPTAQQGDDFLLNLRIVQQTQ
jgi:hypothetical protein